MNLPENFIENATRHFNHAVAKHPRFADFETNHRFLYCAATLSDVRAKIFHDDFDGLLTIPTLVKCEVLEALCETDKTKKCEEIYDAIAVLMRWLCVVEGTQVLGDACVNDPSRPCVDCEMPCAKKHNAMFEEGGAK